jgi:hypothetical protein
VGPEDESARDDALTESGQDPRGWDRASIRLRTHPLHPMPDVSSSDFLLAYRPDPLKLAGDCAVVGGACAILVYFPLLLVAFTITVDIRAWIFGTMLAAGLAGAAYVAWSARNPDTRDLDRF